MPRSKRAPNAGRVIRYCTNKQHITLTLVIGREGRYRSETLRKMPIFAVFGLLDCPTRKRFANSRDKTLHTKAICSFQDKGDSAWAARFEHIITTAPFRWGDPLQDDSQDPRFSVIHLNVLCLGSLELSAYCGQCLRNMLTGEFMASMRSLKNPDSLESPSSGTTHHFSSHLIFTLGSTLRGTLRRPRRAVVLPSLLGTPSLRAMVSITEGKAFSRERPYGLLEVIELS